MSRGTELSERKRKAPALSLILRRQVPNRRVFPCNHTEMFRYTEVSCWTDLPDILWQNLLIPVEQVLDFGEFSRFLSYRGSFNFCRTVMEDRSDPFGFARKSFPMLTIQACQRLGAATVISGLLFVVGCRSASVNRFPTVPGWTGGPSFYRSYEKPAQPYDDQNSDQSTAPEPDPPSELPAPGYSEPSSPPTPSAKKSRWNLNNAGLKFPSFTRPNNEVHQTGANSERAVSKSILKSVPTTPKTQPVEVEEEVVQPRSTSRANIPKLSSKVLPFATPSSSSPDASVGDMPLLLPPSN